MYRGGGSRKGRGRRSLLRSDVVRNVDARAREYVFANVGAVLEPPLMKLFRSSDGGGMG